MITLCEIVFEVQLKSKQYIYVNVLKKNDLVTIIKHPDVIAFFAEEELNITLKCYSNDKLIFSFIEHEIR